MRRLIPAFIAALGLILVTATPTHALTYGWKWAEVVDVYDATGSGGNWKVAQAVREWDRTSGVGMRMTTDLAAANIVVRESVMSSAGTAQVESLPVVDGIVSGQCLIDLNVGIRDMGVAEEIALHEIGHCLGLDHSDVRESVMHYGASATNYYTRPTAYDVSDMRALYGRR